MALKGNSNFRANGKYTQDEIDTQIRRLENKLEDFVNKRNRINAEMTVIRGQIKDWKSLDPRQRKFVFDE